MKMISFALLDHFASSKIIHCIFFNRWSIQASYVKGIFQHNDRNSIPKVGKKNIVAGIIHPKFNKLDRHESQVYKLKVRKREELSIFCWRKVCVS